MASAAQHLRDFHKSAHEFHSKMVGIHNAQLEKAKSGNAGDQAAQSARAFHEGAVQAQ